MFLFFAPLVYRERKKQISAFVHAARASPAVNLLDPPPKSFGNSAIYLRLFKRPTFLVRFFRIVNQSIVNRTLHANS